MWPWATRSEMAREMATEEERQAVKRGEISPEGGVDHEGLFGVLGQGGDLFEGQFSEDFKERKLRSVLFSDWPPCIPDLSKYG